MSAGEPPTGALRAHHALRADIAGAQHRFLAELTHELRSALTIIAGNADMLAINHPDLEDKLQPIIEAAERIDAIMQELVQKSEDELTRDDVTR